MSDGSWNYKQLQLKELFKDISGDKYVISLSPRMAKTVGLVGSILNDIIHDLDWHISRDTIINDPKAFEVKYLEKLKDALKRHPLMI